MKVLRIFRKVNKKPPPCLLRKGIANIKKLTYSFILSPQGPKMDLYFWLPSMFFLGVVAMGICLLFMKGCEKI